MCHSYIHYSYLQIHCSTWVSFFFDLLYVYSVLQSNEAKNIQFLPIKALPF